jgi:3-oxoacyl-(acyl-carrier-protein) synthase
VEKKERKHVSRILPLALCASTEALASAGIKAASLPLEERRRFGVIMGVPAAGRRNLLKKHIVSCLTARPAR